jgi:hypothetical protein
LLATVSSASVTRTAFPAALVGRPAADSSSVTANSSTARSAMLRTIFDDRYRMGVEAWMTVQLTPWRRRDLLRRGPAHAS